MSEVSDLNRQLFATVREKNWSQVDLLLRKGANIEATQDEGTTPLQLAAILGHVDMVKHLVARGANINAANDRGGTVLFMARSGYTLARKVGGDQFASERLELVKWLRQHGAHDTPGTEPKRGCAMPTALVIALILTFIYFVSWMA